MDLEPVSVRMANVLRNPAPSIPVVAEAWQLLGQGEYSYLRKLAGDYIDEVLSFSNRGAMHYSSVCGPRPVSVVGARYCSRVEEGAHHGQSVFGLSVDDIGYYNLLNVEPVGHVHELRRRERRALPSAIVQYDIVTLLQPEPLVELGVFPVAYYCG